VYLHEIDGISHVTYLTDLIFFQRKVQYIKSTCALLKSDYSCDIPSTVEDLCKLPGVGPKMAHLTMNIAWEIQSGIGAFNC
jgi:endonuclease-3